MLCWALISVLGSCATLKNWYLGQVQHLDGFELQPPSALGQNVALTQHVVFRYQDQKISSINQLEWDQERMVIAAFSHLGGALFTITFDGKNMHSEINPAMPDLFHAGLVLKDYQICFLPFDALERAFSLNQYRIDSELLQRNIYRGNELVYVIQYEYPTPWRGQVTLRNLMGGYSISFNNLDGTGNE